MSDLTEFEPWPKIHRLRRGMVITEKIDGSNGQISIRPFVDTGGGLLTFDNRFDPDLDTVVEVSDEKFAVRAGSRKRWLSPNVKGGDNFGFAAWVREHSTELATTLGVGRHYGEWYGQGIQRGYDLDTRHFALFNAHRWRQDFGPMVPEIQLLYASGMGLGVVPALYVGPWSDDAIDWTLERLRFDGSHVTIDGYAAEGVVVFHEASRTNFKVLLDHDELPKSLVGAAS